MVLQLREVNSNEKTLRGLKDILIGLDDAYNNLDFDMVDDCIKKDGEYYVPVPRVRTAKHEVIYLKDKVTNLVKSLD